MSNRTERKLRFYREQAEKRNEEYRKLHPTQSVGFVTKPGKSGTPLMR